MQNKKRLVVVADDFGWTKGCNEGIYRGYSEGIVTEVSLMLNAPASDDAINLIAEKKIKNVGIHMALIGYNEHGRSFKRDDYVRIFKEKPYQEIEALAEKEVNEFETSIGHKPTHICPQYGIHGNLKLLTYLLSYAYKNNIPVRIPRTTLVGDIDENYAAEIMLRRSGVRTTNHLFGHIVTTPELNSVEAEFISDLKTVKDTETAEILTHPGYFDMDLLNLSSLAYERVRDLALVLSKPFRKELERMNFKLVSYSEI